MDEARRAWCKKYEVNIAEGGFIDSTLPEHVTYVLPTRDSGRRGHYIGFDGRAKTWEQLTEEEKQDYQAQLEEVPERIKKYLNKNGTQKEM